MYNSITYKNKGELAVLPKHLKYYQAYYSDFSNRVGGYKNLYLQNSGITSGSSNNTLTGNQWGDLALGLTSDMASIFTMAMMAKAESGAAAKTPGTDKKMNSQILVAAKQVVSQYPSKKATAVTDFNAKYADAGISMSADGKLSKTYAQAEAGIKADIETLKKNLDDNNTTTDGIQNDNKTAYETAKATYEGYAAALKSYDNYTASIETMRNNSKDKTITIVGEGDAQRATGKDPEARDFIQYVSPEKLKSCETEAEKHKEAKKTSKYQAAKAANEQEATKFNGLVEARKKALPADVTDENDLKHKMEAAKTKMDKAGEQAVNSTGQTAAQHDMAIKNLESKLAALGTKADFDAAVKEVTDLDAEYKEAKELIDANTAATEDANALAYAKDKKRDGHTGFRGKMYDLFHKDKPEVKTNFKNAKTNASSSQIALQQMYAKYYKET